MAPNEIAFSCARMAAQSPRSGVGIEAERCRVTPICPLIGWAFAGSTITVVITVIEGLLASAMLAQSSTDPLTPDVRSIISSGEFRNRGQNALARRKLDERRVLQLVIIVRAKPDGRARFHQARFVEFIVAIATRRLDH